MIFSDKNIWVCAFGFAAFGWCAGVLADEYEQQRHRLVAEEIKAAGVTNPAVLEAMRKTPRHEFVPQAYRRYAYVDAALPIGEQQTISPPFVVAYMTEQLDPQPTERVLEIGTGSGYQAAVLSPLVQEVYTIEIVKRLGQRAERVLQRLGYDNVHVRVGDGYLGWPEAAPFDKIIVTCSPESIPQPLVEQLREGGTMIIPVGQRYQQNIYKVTKRNGELEKMPLRATLFVPMTGAAEASREVLPDPTQPEIVNGSFERVLSDSELPEAWHYLREAKAVESDQAPEGERYLSFSNDRPGEASRALQGMGLDGRAVSQLKLSAMVRGERLNAGLTGDQIAGIVITFYDAHRAVIGNERLGPLQGTFDWQSLEKTIRVPLATREAIVRIGLLGGVGRLDVDGVRVEVEGGE